VIHWPSYNQSLVRRGEILFSYDFLNIWDDDLARMNENKNGKKYKFPDSFILIISHIKIYFHLPYRQTEGIIKATIGKKSYLKIHVAVNIKTKEIIALEVTDEKVHDGKVMKQLIEQVLNNNHNIKIKSFLGDGAYDSNENFKYLKEKRIQPIIKVKRNSIISYRNNKIRNKEVQVQTKDYYKWKKKRRYGQRWMIETAFSSIKRMFGEYTSAIRFQNIIKEMTIKVSLYNLFRRIV